MDQPNKELLEFNNSKKNQRLLNDAKGYVFISCPDFSHQNGKYTYKGIGGGIPLTFSLAQKFLQELSSKKEVSIYLSDHEASRLDVQCHLKMSEQSIMRCIYLSIEKIELVFSQTRLLSELYSYEEVIEAKELVSEDSHMQNVVLNWMNGAESAEQLKNKYREKYAQMYVFMNYCKQQSLCPVLLYSKFNLSLTSAIRKIISIPILFLEAVDPH